MKTKKLVSILLTALLLTQVFNFSALAASTVIEKSENLVQTAVSEWLAEYNKTAETEATQISKVLQFGTADVPGVILKYDTSKDYSDSQERDAYLAVDGANTATKNGQCYFPRQTNNNSSARTGRFSLNLQRQHSFNTIVIYEKGTTSKFSDLTVTTADGYVFPENADYTVPESGEAGGLDYNEIDDYTRFTTGKKSYAADKLGGTTESHNSNTAIKHTIYLPETETAQFVSLQFNYTAGSAPAIIEVEIYHETRLGDVSVTEADGTVTAEVSVEGLTSEHEDMVLLLAEYEGSVLENVNLGKIDTITAGNATINASLTKVDGRTYKAFLFKSIGTLIPLQEATPLEN